VSVVICNYNYGQYLAEAIYSVLEQTYKNTQVIVVDDGSTDNSGQILESIHDPRLKVVYQHNSGQAAAFNSGFQECKGEFIAFLDSDDFWFNRKLEISIPAFDAGNISVVQHNLQIVGSKSELSGDTHPNIKPGRKSLIDSYIKENHTGFFSATSGIICRKSDLDSIFPIDSTWKICADVALTRPLPIFGDIVTLEEVLGGYRIHGENNWMNTAEQKNWLENQQGYVNYTNSWLAKCGLKERIDFEKSDRYQIYKEKCGMPASYWLKIGFWFKKAMRRVSGFQ
jgi:glycosyltransferase involved in cell wall biosynthesis